MRRIRRSNHETRLEIMPLIDVIFLLLTFFIYAMVLMIRADLLPMEMPEFASGTPATPSPAVTISIDRKGDLFVDREPVTIDTVVEKVKEIVAFDPKTAVYVAADKEGSQDRLPMFLALYDQLALEGLNIQLVGMPSEVDAP
jgi:biopolymer transport protein ExbD